MKICLSQLNSTNDEKHNKQIILNSTKEAILNKCDIIIFPEDCLYYSSYQSKLEFSKTITNEFFKDYYYLSKKIKMIFGGVPIYNKKLNKYYNSVVLLDNESINVLYRKKHLFNVSLENLIFRESDYVISGKNISNVLTFEEFSIAFVICFDIRFSELFAKIKHNINPDIIIVTAAFMAETGSFHWKPVLQSRSIEFQSYILAVNQIGYHENLNHELRGESMIINPWGSIEKSADSMGYIEHNSFVSTKEYKCLNYENIYFEFSHKNKQLITNIRNKIPMFVI